MVVSAFLVRREERSSQLAKSRKPKSVKKVTRKRRERKSVLPKLKKVEWTLRPEILLCPNTPAPMHGVVPRNILGTKWWNATRKAAYALTNFHCHACGTFKSDVKGSRKHLEGHELYDVDYKAGTITYIETIALCPYCHQYIHDGRLFALMKKRIITQKKYTSVIQHGDAILHSAGLERLTRVDRDKEIRAAVLKGEVAEWSKWRLILRGNQYPPKYKTVEQWEKAHA
tara:strand:+ start:722 stop:1405 length:684 start_codon:yes stop_codon:yes gene_type:complete